MISELSEHIHELRRMAREMRDRDTNDVEERIEAASEAIDEVADTIDLLLSKIQELGR